jgi:hypothetical protein
MTVLVGFLFDVWTKDAQVPDLRQGIAAGMFGPGVWLLVEMDV